jgi:hypothetical protein
MTRQAGNLKLKLNHHTNVWAFVRLVKMRPEAAIALLLFSLKKNTELYNSTPG